MFLATGGNVGRIPVASGTFGSLVGLPIVYVFSLTDWTIAAALTAALILFSVWVAHMAEQQLKAKDPGCIVIDEIAGMCVAMLGIPLTLSTGAAGFFFVPPVRRDQTTAGPADGKTA